MEFQQSFLNVLQANTTLTKSLIDNFLPKFLPKPIGTSKHLPYVQAYANILTPYFYSYSLSNLDSYCLLYTESGSGTLLLNNHFYSLLPNTFAFINCQENYIIDTNETPWNYKVFFIKGDPIPSLYSSFIHNHGNIYTFSTRSGIPQLLDKFYFQLDRNLENAFLEAKFILDILLEIMIEKNRIEAIDQSIPDYLIKIKLDFDTNYNKSFKLDELEQKYHISKYRICHEFSKQFDMSPIQYLNRKRIEVAKDSLIYTDKRINEIGCMVGIENTNHFIRLFKQETGVTPLVFRKQSPAFTLLH